MNSLFRTPPTGAPRFGGRMYQHNLRPIVIALAVMAGLFSLFSGIGFFRAISEEKSENVSDLVPFSIALGALYLAVTAIEIFGAVAAGFRRTALVRIYTILSVITTLVVIASGVLRVVIHFTKKNELISECSQILDRDGVAVYPFGFWGPIREDDLTPDEASDWCRRSWDHDSVSEIVSLLITSFLATFFTLLVFSYYRQLMDPQSVANASRAPSAGMQHYTPPYNLGYGYNMPYAGGPPPGPPGQWAPPQGPPPQFAPPAGHPPGYVGDGGYAGEKEQGDNPFEDFTEAHDQNKNQNKP